MKAPSPLKTVEMMPNPNTAEHRYGSCSYSCLSRQAPMASMSPNLPFVKTIYAHQRSNASVIGNVELLFAALYPEALTDTMYSRLSNSFLIGMIIGMILFGYVADQLGRKTGAVATTIILTVGIILSAAATGTSQTGMLWMLVIARGISGVGAGGEYPVTGMWRPWISSGQLLI